MATIFISYRRDDTPGFAGRLEDDLSERFGDAQVFRDREIPAGSDFARHLEDQLRDAAVVLVVIGRHWLDVRDAEGRLRLDSPTDWVRREVEAALAGTTPIVPVLVGGAAMPWPDQLPDSLAPLAGRQAISLSDQHWGDDIETLSVQLCRLSPELAEHFQARHVDHRPDLLKVLRERLDEAGRAAGGAGGGGGFGRWVAGRLGKLFGAVVTLAVLYILVRALGGSQLNRMLDRVIATTVEQVRAVF
ncbi:toll/interleukin-1 receptor domain-containing protein [Denitromonas iodatirespirans]|uniref:Toll/interleukin-1 receptor domain-containing protein n=1 Tax=Denitromonas iodatirespirans TaxID=2795389 RepID=A0A944DDJ7_DENI1|nr:toll/interleukin-1 receptor domain-containing protein [Denitromonas iodatirespirans]MBT0963492.1 toll/interleukin-1 receptor domain-containing protein [Denitromonas iodatirespirans]